MNAISSQLEQELRSHAEDRGMAVEDLVRNAVNWYLRLDPELLDELEAWQEIQDEAVSGFDESL